MSDIGKIGEMVNSRSAGNPLATSKATNNGKWYGRAPERCLGELETKVIEIRPSTQGSWEYPKSASDAAHGKLNDKE